MKPSLVPLVLLCFCLLGLAPALAQDAPAPLSPSQIAARLKPLHPKTVIFVFDVTQSTRHGGVFTLEREATATLLRQGCSPGDRVILLKFGTGYGKVFDQTLTGPGDVDPLIDKLPPAPEPGRGTNIRWPHHEALKLIARDNLCPAVIILLTDSFNDRPDLADPNYPKYRAYYTLKGLTIYPDSAENRDYVRLLRSLTARGCLHQYGVGVSVAPDGRPIERLPVGPGQGDSDAGTTTESPTVLAPTGLAPARPLWPLLLGLLLGLLLLLLLLWLFLRNRAVPLRLKLGDKGLPRDFRLRPGDRLALGGAPGTTPGHSDIFPLAGLAAPAAALTPSRGAALLTPAPPADGSGEAAPALFHNGLPVQGPVPLRVGDEIRVFVPPTALDPARDHRLRVEDPRGPVF